MNQCSLINYFRSFDLGISNSLKMWAHLYLETSGSCSQIFFLFFHFLRHCINIGASFELCHAVWLLILSHRKCFPGKYLLFWSSLIPKHLPIYGHWYAGYLLEEMSWNLPHELWGHKSGWVYCWPWWWACLLTFCFSATVQDLICQSSCGSHLFLRSFQRTEIYPMRYSFYWSASGFNNNDPILLLTNMADTWHLLLST